QEDVASRQGAIRALEQMHRDQTPVGMAGGWRNQMEDRSVALPAPKTAMNCGAIEAAGAIGCHAASGRGAARSVAQRPDGVGRPVRIAAGGRGQLNDRAAVVAGAGERDIEIAGDVFVQRAGRTSGTAVETLDGKKARCTRSNRLKRWQCESGRQRKDAHSAEDRNAHHIPPCKSIDAKCFWSKRCEMWLRTAAQPDAGELTHAPIRIDAPSTAML